jgi:hypothetical protein
MNDTATGVIDSRKDFKNDPRGQYNYWQEELAASITRRKNWWKQGEKIVARYLDYRGALDDASTYIDTNRTKRLNLFHSNITTLTSMLYGNLPKIDVSRRFADANDDVSRVAAEILERLLNNDIAENGEEVNAVLRSTLQDRLLPGLGCARVRYEFESEMRETEVQAMDAQGNPVIQMQQEEVLLWEDAPVDYFYWGDVLWGWGRNWAQIPWIAFRVYLTKDEVEERFDKQAADKVTYSKQKPTDDNNSFEDSIQADVWNKAEIWEIWDKKSRKVVFVSLGYNKVLDTKDDPLQLSGFFPAPPFFLANQTTTLYSPTPDYHLAQDLYTEIDLLHSRISVITKAVRVVGVYDSSSAEVARMFKEGTENAMIPVENWALFGERGGLDGAIDWFPIQDVVNALDKLRQLRDETIGLLQQITGMNEIMRGGTNGQYEGVGQAELQAKFGSIRIQALQDEFSVFCSNLMQLKAEVVCRHFSPETIAQMSNISSSYDADIAPQAIELLKKPELARMKVEIRPESVAMVDYAQLKAERTDYINALATFMQSAAPLIEQQPKALPFLMELLKWGLAGFKGSQEIEGIIDKAIDQAQKEVQNPDQQQDPEQAKLQMQNQLEKMKQEGKLREIQAKAVADAQLRQLDKQSDIETTYATHQAKMAEIRATLQSKIAEVRAKLEADLAIERAQAESNIAQTEANAQAEIGKDVVSTQLEVGKEATKTELKIEEIAASATAKMREANAKSKGDD